MLQPVFSRRLFSNLSLLQGTVQATCTSNNTHAIFHDNFGKMVVKLSAGCLPRKSNKRGSALMAQKVGEELGKKMKPLGYKHVNVIYKGIGKGRGSVHRGLEMAGISIVQIGEKNITPHNGCRPPSLRRL